MPRTTGVSSRTTLCWSLVKPSERAVSLIFCLLPMGLRRSVILSLADMGRVLQFPHPGNERIHRRPAQAGDLLGAFEALERLYGGPGDIDGVGGAERFAQHVMDARQFQNGADATSGHDTGSGRRGLEQDF